MLSSVHNNPSSLLQANTQVSNDSSTGSATDEFAEMVAKMTNRLHQGLKSRRKGGETSPDLKLPSPTATPASTTSSSTPATPGVGDVVQSPFNVLGLPISGTLAPTAAEVTANPDKYAGTSFDPKNWLTQG